MPWQPAGVIFPDVEIMLPNAIRPLLAARGKGDVYTGHEIPNEAEGGRRAKMVLFTRDGGDDNGHTDRPRVRVRVFERTPEDATELANLVAGLLQLLVGSTAVTYARKLSGPFNVPDETGHDQRYLLFEIHTRPEGMTT
jgi:hypothetical protein